MPLRMLVPIIGCVVAGCFTPARAADTETGFVRLFNGTDLTGWEVRRCMDGGGWSDQVHGEQGRKTQLADLARRHAKRLRIAIEIPIH